MWAKPVYLLYYAPYIAAYQLSNRFPLFAPQELPFTALDRAIPFLPQLLCLYVSYLIYYFVTVSRMENDVELTRVLVATYFQLVVAVALFVVFPVRMPREIFYTAADGGLATGGAFAAFWHWFDAPNNCFPSLHVANVLLLLEVNTGRRPWRKTFVAWGIAIVASTVLVKQHYVVDVLGGAALYGLAHLVVSRVQIYGVDDRGFAEWRHGRGRAVAAAGGASLAVTAGMLGLTALLVGRADGPTGTALAAEQGAKAPVSAQWDSKDAAYAGSQACQNCHRPQYADWQNSAHALALWSTQQPPQALVAAQPFATDRLSWAGGQAVLRRQAGPSAVSVLVAEQGVDPGPFRVVAMLGGRALAQPVVETEPGRLQALPVGYDPAKREWFDIFADSPRTPQDWGHWTGRGMRANSECIACHVTGFRKGYDAEHDSYTSRWAESGVGCEGCHGAGAAHVAQPRLSSAQTVGGGGYGRLARQGLADTCARCHGLRRELGEDTSFGASWLDGFEPVLTSAVEYHADGSVAGEAYEWGSFSQSLMHDKAVTCLDCHTVHGGGLVRDGDALCLGCHDARLGRSEHTHHPVGAGVATAQCVDCHMPEQAFMMRDLRRDHAMVLPDPRLSAAIGARDPCTACHQGKSAQWAAGYVERWFEAGSAEREQRRRTVRAFFNVRSGETRADDITELVGCTKRCEGLGRRAAATRLLQGPAGRGDRGAAEQLLALARSDEDLIRMAAVSALADLDVSPWPEWASRRRSVLVDATHDRFRVLRTAAAWGLRYSKTSDMAAPDAEALQVALAELEQVLIYQRDHAEPATTLAMLYEARGRIADAQRAYEYTVSGWPTALPARYRLALLYAEQRRIDQARTELERLRELEPGFSPARFALAMLYGDVGRWREVVSELTACLKAEPYYPGALHDLCHAYLKLDEPEPDLAHRVLLAALEHPRARAEALETLVSVELELGNRAAARRWAERAVAETPGLADRPRIRALLSEAETPSPPADKNRSAGGN